MSPPNAIAVFLPRLGLLSLLVLAGCSAWQPADVELSGLPATRMSDNTVVWEVDAVYATADEAEFHDQLWMTADEQSLPVDLSRRLASNGFRCGLVGMPLPTVLRQRLDEQKAVPAGSSASLPVSDLTRAYPYRRLQARPGQRYEIVGPEVREELTALRLEDGLVCGDRYPQAECVLALRSLPQNDGRVKLEVTPEIHYGPARQHITGRGGALQVESRRDRKVFDDLRLEADISPGQTLLLTTTRDAKGLGNEFFTQSSGDRRQQKILLIRLAQTQPNGLLP